MGRLYVFVITQRLEVTMRLDSSVCISTNNRAKGRRREFERKTDLRRDSPLAAAITERKREREGERE